MGRFQLRWREARLSLWGAAVAVMASCASPSLPDAEVQAVSPERAWQGADVPITIDGSNFFPGIEVDARGYGADLDRGWDVFLVGDGRRLPLLGEDLESDTRLRALVPAGFPAGDYSLELVAPSGDVTSSEVGLEVTESQEVAFLVSYFDDPSAYVAGEQVRFVVQAVGQDSERVFADVPVVVRLSGAAMELATTVAFDDVVLDDDEAGFEAVLPDGEAVLIVDLLAPGRLDVSASSPPDADSLQADSLSLVVGGGSDLPATIEVPDDVLVAGAEAGTPFDVVVTVYDERGDVVEETLDLVLGNDCGGLDKEVVVRGPTVVSVALTQSTTSGGCGNGVPGEDDGDRIRVEFGAQGQSESFPVRGGPADRFELLTLTQELEAGRPDTVAVIRPQDAYGNTTSWSGTLTVTDDLGTLTDIACQAAPQVLLCNATPTLAGDDITIFVEGDDGLQAERDGFRVTPAPEPASLGIQLPTKVRAGQFADVQVLVYDVYGNPQLPEQIDPTGMELTSDPADAVCTLGGVGLAGEVSFSCLFTLATSDATLTAIGGGAAAGLSDTVPIEVLNGSVGAVSFIAPAAVLAGEGFTLEISAFDSFGNPYLVQDDPVIDLVGAADSLLPTQALLTPLGTATVAANITTSGTWTLSAEQGGLPLGVSDPITVSAGPTDGLAVDVQAPWGEVGVPVDVVVEAVDAYGNRTALTEALTVSSRLTGAADQVVALTNGIVTLSWTWDQRAVDEILDVASVTFVGESDPLYVVENCITRPTTDLLLNGDATGLVCMDDGLGYGSLNVDLSGSTPGPFPIVGYGVAVDGPMQLAQVSPSATADLELSEVGQYVVRAISIDLDACADEQMGAVFVGFDDGTPTGPVELIPSASTIDVSSSVVVDLVGVTDCAGDPAAGAEVLVRSHAGSLSGVATGEGLAVTLDAVGDGTVDLTTAGDVADNGVDAGQIDVVAWTPWGSAAGGATLDLSGDAVPPTVIGQAPSGQTTGLVDTIVLDFSEPILASTALVSRFTLSGPGTSAVTDVLVDTSQITLTVDPPADATAGAWFLTVSDDVRDEGSGNRLSGDWSGAAATYLGAFGDVGAVPEVLTCPSVQPDGGVFRPDGDDGSGVDADYVDIELSTAAAPAWWVAEVHDELGGLVVQRWAVPTGPADSWAWDGRDEVGFIVPNGTYTITVRPDDGSGNRGTGCVVQAVVDNLAEAM